MIYHILLDYIVLSHRSKAGHAGGRKSLPIECAQGDQPVRCPNRGFCAHHPSAIPSGGDCLCLPGALTELFLD